MDYSISLNGIRAAQNNLEQTAKRIAAPNPNPDFAAELIQINQAKNTAKANLRVVSARQELEGEILDLFA